MTSHAVVAPIVVAIGGLSAIALGLSSTAPNRDRRDERRAGPVACAENSCTSHSWRR
jgi:hypothetical protein